MHIIVPIAGRGSRFKEMGYKDPKPLIDILGKTMVEWALSCIEYDPAKLIFIVLDRQAKEHQIDRKLKGIFGEKITIILSDGVTEGAACSVLLAKDLIDNEEDLIIYNADQYFQGDAMQAIKEKDKDTKGMIATFHSTHTKWSYAKTDADNVVTETAEKIPISTNATVGLYYFSRGKDFVWAAEEMIRKDIRRNNEFYVCPVYNQLIERGDKVTIIPVEKMWSLGTPEDVEHFKKYFKNGGSAA